MDIVSKPNNDRHVLSFSRKLFLSVISLFLVFAVCFIAYQYQREKEYKVELLDTQLQDYNERLQQELRNNRHTLFLFGHSLSPLYHPFSIALQRKSDKQPGCRPALSLVYDYRYSIADICILQIYIQTGYGNQPLTRVCQTCR